MCCQTFYKHFGHCRSIGFAETERAERQRSTALRLLLSDTADRVPVALTVAVDICAATIEVQVVSVVTIAGGRRPVVAVGPAIVERAIVVVPAVDPQEGTGC